MSQRNLYRGATEFIDVEVVAEGVTLTAQPVAFSFNRTDWFPAEWIGDPGPVRIARLLLTPTNTPGYRDNQLYVKVTDSPEIPIMLAGILSVR